MVFGADRLDMTCACGGLGFCWARSNAAMKKPCIMSSVDVRMHLAATGEKFRCDSYGRV